MKKLLPLLLLLPLFLLAAPPSGKVNLIWDYPTNELSTDLVFKIYTSTNITIPLTNWVVLTNVVGTNTSVQLTVTPGINFFVATASNFWGESDFSNVASTPGLPRSNVNLKINRGD